jgi:hypothetical protein
MLRPTAAGVSAVLGLLGVALVACADAFSAYSACALCFQAFSLFSLDQASLGSKRHNCRPFQALPGFDAGDMILFSFAPSPQGMTIQSMGSGPIRENTAALDQSFFRDLAYPLCYEFGMISGHALWTNLSWLWTQGWHKRNPIAMGENR